MKLAHSRGSSDVYSTKEWKGKERITFHSLWFQKRQIRRYLPQGGAVEVSVKMHTRA